MVKFCSSLSLNITAFLHHIDVLCQLCIRQGDEATLGKLFTHTRASVTKQQIWYRSRGCPAAGKVSVGLASSHWPCVTNFDGLSTYVLTACGRDRITLHLLGFGGWGGSVAEWLACWTQAQKARVQIASTILSGNSLRQTVHTYCASVHQASKLVAALLKVAGVTAGLA